MKARPSRSRAPAQAPSRPRPPRFARAAAGRMLPWPTWPTRPRSSAWSPPRSRPSAASKWGMIGLTRTLALEAGEHGITVNAIAPGSVRGERMDAVIRSRAQSLGRPYEEVERSYLDPTALKRMVEPVEVAATAVFLASDEARSITRETLSVSAG